MPTWCGLPNANAEFEHAAQFRSRHAGVVHFCFGDGSVRMLRSGSSWIDWWNGDLPAMFPSNYSSEWWVFQELAGKSDGGTRGALAFWIDHDKADRVPSLRIVGGHDQPRNGESSNRASRSAGLS